MAYAELKDESVFAFIGRSSKSIIVEVISDDPESLELSYKLFIKVLEDCGLKWRDI